MENVNQPNDQPNENSIYFSENINIVLNNSSDNNNNSNNQSVPTKTKINNINFKKF